MIGHDHYRVLLIEDNELDARAMVKNLAAAAQCEVERVSDLASGLAAVHESAFDCVLLDLSLPDSEGLVSVETMVAKSAHCPVVVLTGLDDPEAAVEAVQRGAQDYLVKSTVTPDLVARAIRYAVARHSAETELLGVKERLHDMHARDQIARDLHDTVIQRLFASGMTLQAATSLQSRDELTDRVLVVVDEIDAAIKELREAIFGLHALEDHESFVLQVGQIAESFSDSLGFEPVVRLGALPELPEALGQDMLAVVREALSNVARHANATTATLTVTAVDQQLVVRVTDNGIGTTDLDAQRSSGHGRSGNGLKNMQKRADAQAGSLQFSAGPNGGSELCWSVPIPAT